MRACVHQCDSDGWIQTRSGLMPCPKHNLEAHERWAEGSYLATGPTGVSTAPHRPDADTTRNGLAAAREALRKANDTKRHETTETCW